MRAEKLRAFVRVSVLRNKEPGKGLGVNIPPMRILTVPLRCPAQGRDVALLIVTVMVAFGFSVAVMVSAMPARDGSPVLLLARPWGTPALQIAVAYGGQSIAPWALRDMVALVRFDGAIPVDALRDAGVLAVLDGQAVAALCGVD